MKAKINFKEIKKDNPKPKLAHVLGMKETKLIEHPTRIIIMNDFYASEALFFIMGGVLFGFAIHMGMA